MNPKINLEKHMKNITLITISMLFAANVNAALPKEINALAGKLGTFTSLYNGKSVADETGTDCKVGKSQYGENTVVIDSDRKSVV